MYPPCTDDDVGHASAGPAIDVPFVPLLEGESAITLWADVVADQLANISRSLCVLQAVEEGERVNLLRRVFLLFKRLPVLVRVGDGLY